MVDLVCALILLAYMALVTATYGVFALLPARAPNKRLDGHGGVMLSRGIMEVAYKLFDPLIDLLLALRITPNMVTAFSLFPAFFSAICVAGGHFGLGALLATFSGFCDMVDGILARRYNSMSDVGELFDAAMDRYVEFFLLAGLTYYFRNHAVTEVVCLGAILGSFMVSYATAKAEALGVPPPSGAMRRAERAVYLILGCVLVPVWARFMPEPHVIGGLFLGRELPVQLAMLVVAVVANVSAVRRMVRTAQLIRVKKRAV
jgi:CDP-diacylglycerol--glycerol-3-phosphate 3-phosphatidyltransferase